MHVEFPLLTLLTGAEAFRCTSYVIRYDPYVL